MRGGRLAAPHCLITSPKSRVDDDCAGVGARLETVGGHANGVGRPLR